MRFVQTVIVGDGNHCAFDNRRMSYQRRFNLDRRDPDASRLDHVVGAATVNVEAVGVLCVLSPVRIHSPLIADFVASCLFQ